MAAPLPDDPYKPGASPEPKQLSHCQLDLGALGQLGWPTRADPSDARVGLHATGPHPGQVLAGHRGIHRLVDAEGARTADLSAVSADDIPHRQRKPAAVFGSPDHLEGACWLCVSGLGRRVGGPDGPGHRPL